ncbi:MAG: hypothetical protein KTR25_09640 [Myxococcales bacterium]|nr:hypothetical protein [Myxococcales bacterium]
MAEIGEAAGPNSLALPYNPTLSVAPTLDNAGRVNAEALASAEAPLRVTEAWSDLVELHVEAATRAPDAELGCSLWLSAGRLVLDKLADPQRAEVYLRRALVGREAHLETVDALAQAMRLQGRQSLAARLLEQALPLAPSEVQPTRAVALSRLVNDELHELQRAVYLLLATDQRVKSGNPLLLTEARRLLIQDMRFRDAIDVLEQEIRRHLGDGAERFFAVNTEVPAEKIPEYPEKSTIPQAVRLDIQDALCQLSEQLSHFAVFHKHARTLLARAHMLGDTSAATRLTALDAIQQNWEQHASQARSSGLGARDKRAAAKAYLRAAQLYWTYGNDSHRSKEYFERAQLLDPGDNAALQVHEEIALSEKTYDQRITQLQKLVEIVRDADVRVRLLQAIARVAEAKAGTDDSAVRAEAGQLAVDAHRRAWEVDPSRSDLTARLVDVLEQFGRSDERQGILQRFAETSKDKDLVASTWLELGRLAADNEQVARGYLTKALELSATKLEAAELLFTLGDDLDDSPQHKLTRIKILEQHAPDLASRIQWVKKQVELARGVGPEETFLALKRRLMIDPQADEVRGELFELAQEFDRCEEFAEALTVAAQIRGQADVTELWVQAAKIYEDRMPNTDRAVVLWRKVLELDPTHQEAKASLEGHARAEANPTALIELLTQQLENAQSDMERRTTKLKLAEALAHRKDGIEKAILLLESIRAEDPLSNAALRQLSNIYARLERWGDLEQVLADQERSLASDEGARISMALERAAVLERLTRDDEAIAIWLNHVQLRPQDVIDPLARHMVGRTGQTALHIAQALVPIYRSRGEASMSELDALEVIAREIDVLEKRKDAAISAADISLQLGEFERGLNIVLPVLREWPADEQLLSHVEVLGARSPRPASIAQELLELAALHADSPETHADILTVAGTLYPEPGLAFEAYRAVLEVKPGHEAALNILEAHLVETERYTELVDLLRSQLERLTAPLDRVRVARTLGAVLQDRVKDTQGAADAYRQVLAVDPNETTALTRLTELLSPTEASEELVTVFSRLRSGVSDSSEAACLDARMGDLFRIHIGDFEQAYTYYVRGLETDRECDPAVTGLDSLLTKPPVSVRAGQMLATIYAEKGDVEGQIRAIEAQMSDDPSPELHSELLSRVVELRVEQDDPQGAYDGLLGAFQRGALSVSQHPRLEALARELGAHSTLESIIMARAERTSSADLWRWYARLVSQEHKRTQDAERGWKAVLEHCPDDAEALEALEQLVATGDQPEALAQFLVTRGESAQEPQEKASYFRRAAAQWEEAGRLEAAVVSLKEAQRYAPADQSVWHESVRLLGGLQRYAEQAEALHQEAGCAQESAAKTRLYMTEAVLRQQLGDIEGMVGALSLALEVSPQQKEVRDSLEGLLDGQVAEGKAVVSAALALEPVYRKAEDWPKLSKVYRQLANAASDKEERLERWLMVISIEEDKLKRPDQAWDAAKQAFLEVPERPELLDTLEQLAVRIGEIASLPKLIQAAAEGREHSIQEALVDRAIALAERLSLDPERALPIWTLASEVRPQEPKVLEQLAHCLEKANEPQKAAEVLAARATLATSNERADLYCRAAHLLESLAPERAGKLYQEALGALPGHLTALEGVVRVQGDAPETIKDALTRAVSASEGLEKAQLLLRQGQVLEHQLNQLDGAIEAYATVLRAEQVSEHLAAAEALEGLAVRCRSRLPNLAAEAARQVAPYWRTQQIFPRLVLAKEIESEGAHPSKRRQLWQEVAAVYAHELQQPELAFVTLGKVFMEDPSATDVVEELGRLAVESEAEEEWAELNIQALERVKEPEVRRSLLKRVAHLYGNRLHRSMESAGYYEQILAQDPDDIESLTELERIYRESGESHRLVAVHRRVLSADLFEHDSEAKEQRWFEIAELAENELQDPQQAEEALLALKALRPTDMEVLRRLAALGERMGQPNRMVEALEAELHLTEDVDAKAGLLLQLAALRRDALSDFAGAIRAYKEVLRLRPLDQGAVVGLKAVLRVAGEEDTQAVIAAEVLAPIYRDSGASENYVECLERMAAGQSGAKRKEILDELSVVYQKDLGAPQKAFTATRRAFHEEPTDAAVKERMEELATSYGLLEDLVAVYLDEADSSRGREHTIALRRRVAELFANECGDPERAVIEYQYVLNLDPRDEASLDALEQLLGELQSPEQLAKLYRQRINQTRATSERARLMRALAKVQAESLEDVPSAVATLRRLTQLVPDDLEALEALAGHLEKEARITELSEVLERWLELCTEADQMLPVKVWLGRIRATHMGDLVAADRLLGEVLDIDPTHAAARKYLQDRFEDAAVEGDRALVRSTGAVLVRALETASDWSLLVSLLQRQVTVEPRAVDRAGYQEQIADIQNRYLEQPDMAFDTLAEAVRNAPGIESLSEQLEQLATRLGRTLEVTEVYAQAVAQVPDVEVRERLERRRAQLLEPEDPERAVGAWETVLERHPGDDEALAALDKLLQQLGSWPLLVNVLRQRLSACAEPDRFELSIRLAMLWDERLGDIDEALRYYREAYSEQPDAPEVLTALARLLEPQSNAVELAEVLERQMAQTEDPRGRTRLRIRLAQLFGGPLNETEKAIELWRRVLDNEPDYPDVLDTLEDLLEKAERWEELAEHLETRLKHPTDDAEILRIQRKLGLIRSTQLGNPDDAVTSWQDILWRNPNDIEALDALRTIHRSSKHWDELADVLRRLLPLQANAAAVKTIRFELSQVLQHHLGRSDEAIEVARRVLDLDPHTPEELIQLEQLFTAAEADVEAVRVKLARAEATESVGARVQILFEVAELYERCKRTSGASSAYEKILEIESNNGRAFESLERIYRDNGDYRRLVALYNFRLDQITDIDERRTLLLSVVEVQERRLGHADLAFGAACRACTETGTDETTRSLAERLGAVTDSWDVLAEVYETQLDIASGPELLVLHDRLGHIYRHKLSAPEEAESHFRWVLERDPNNTEVRASLRSLLESADRWNDVVGLLAEQAEITNDPTAKRQLLFEIARLEEQHQQDPDAAIARVKHALDLSPDDPEAQTAMTTLLRKYGRWPALAHFLEHRRDEVSNDEERLARSAELAEVLEKGLGDTARAIEAYVDVLALDPTHRPSLDVLERLYTQEEKWMELITVYERQVELASEPAKAVAFLNRVAGIWEERFQDLEAAGRTLERAIAFDDQDALSVVRLTKIWRRAGDIPKLLLALQKQVALAGSHEEAVELLVEIGELHLQHTNDELEAQKAFHEALKLDPKRKSVVNALANLSELKGDWSDALEMRRRELVLAINAGDMTATAELHQRIGEIYATHLQEPEQAVASYQAALETNPSHEEALRGLSTLLEADEQFEEAMVLKTRLAELTRNRQEQAALFYQASEIALDRLRDSKKAAVFLEKGLDAGPSDPVILEALSDLYFTEKRWREAEKLLERLVQLTELASDSTFLGQLYYRLGYIAEKHGNSSLALSRYHSSYENDYTYLPTLEGLASALVEAERWEDAQRIYQAILIQHRASLTDSEVVDIHFQIGEIACRLDQRERAHRSFRRALNLDRNHSPTLAAMAALAEGEEEWEQAYDYRERLLHVLPDDGQRLNILLQQAKLAESKMGEPWRAIDAYVEVRRLQADDSEILSALARLYRQTSQIQRALEVLSELAVMRTDQDERRDIYIQIADLHLEQKGNVPSAVDALNMALDIDPSHIQAFSRIEQVLCESRAWSALEENYHRMLKRIPKSQRKGRIVLWKSLADLYTKVIDNAEGAKIAYEVLRQLEPNNQVVIARLAEIYATDPATKPEAAELYLSLIPQVNDPAVPIRSLFNLYYEVGILDRSFCALGALILVRAANETERKAYSGLLRYIPQGPARPLTDSQWRTLLFHPYCRNDLAPLMSVVFRGAPTLFTHKQRSLGLKPRRERVDLTDNRKTALARLRYFDVWNSLQRVMHVPAAEHFLRAGSKIAPQLLPGEPSVLFAGRQHPIFSSLSSRYLAWILGRQMALSRPEFALVAALDPESLATCLEAAIRLFVPSGSGVDLKLDPVEVTGWHRQLSRTLSDRAKVALREPVKRVVEQGDMKNLARYLTGVEHTVNRAALLASGDIDTATKALDDCEPQLPDVSHRARVRELMLFVLGSDHFELREKLGLKVTPQAEEAVRQRT